MYISLICRHKVIIQKKFNRHIFLEIMHSILYTIASSYLISNLINRYTKFEQIDPQYNSVIILKKKIVKFEKLKIRF